MEVDINAAFGTFMGRLGYDLAFFVGIVVVVLNGGTRHVHRFCVHYFAMFSVNFAVIFGIIVDTFATLRDQEQTARADQSTLCLMCGLGRATLEKSGRGFRHHTKKEHNMWHYMYYIMHVRRQHKQGVSHGLEQYVFNKLADADFSWLPRGQALSLSRPSQSGATPLIPPPG